MRAVASGVALFWESRLLDKYTGSISGHIKVDSQSEGCHKKQGGRGWLAFVHRSRITQSFRRARICKFLRQKRCFLRLRENWQFVVVKGLKNTQTRSLKHPIGCLDMHFFFTKLLFSESSLEAL